MRVNDLVQEKSPITPDSLSVSYFGFVNGEGPQVLRGQLTFSGSGLEATEPGEYLLSASGLSADNYAINYVDGSVLFGKPARVESAEPPRLPVIPLRTFTEPPVVIPFCQPSLYLGVGEQDDRRRNIAVGSAICGQ